MSSLNRATTIAMLRSAASRSGVSPFSPTWLEQVAELIFLGLQVALVVRIRRDGDWNPFDHLEAEALQTVDLLRVVGEQPYLPDAEVVEDLAADAVVALVGRVAERFVGLDSVHTFVLEVVGVQLVEKADAPALRVPDIENHAISFSRDHLLCRLELSAAIAAEAAEDVAREALRMRP